MTPAKTPSAADLIDLLGADGVLLFAVEGRDLTVVDIAPAHPAAGSLKLQVGFGVTGVVARTGKPTVLESDSPRNALHRQLLRLEPEATVARMCLPLRGLGDRVVGVLAAHRAEPFGAAELEAAESIATVLGLKLHAEQLWRMVNRHRGDRDRLIEQAISAQETERRRIAFDLHDGVTTALATMSFYLSAADLTLSDLMTRHGCEAESLGRARAELVQARELADIAYNQTRAAISGLHTLVLEDLGLVAAMESLVNAASSGGGASVSMFIDPALAVDAIPDYVATALYRILQEALANALKHAEADRIVVSLRQVGSSLVLGCADDGKGFDPVDRLAERATDAVGAEHLGLSSIAERCALIEASLRIESIPGGGTSMLVELPL